MSLQKRWRTLFTILARWLGEDSSLYRRLNCDHKGIRGTVVTTGTGELDHMQQHLLTEHARETNRTYTQKHIHSHTRHTPHTHTQHDLWLGDKLKFTISFRKTFTIAQTNEDGTEASTEKNLRRVAITFTHTRVCRGTTTTTTTASVADDTKQHKTETQLKHAHRRWEVAGDELLPGFVSGCSAKPTTTATAPPWRQQRRRITGRESESESELRAECPSTVLGQPPFRNVPGIGPFVAS
uniref:Putative secreted peptide n=1 Tax=Anopheles braziliensis TaxID=58242 RepID=A0A2M3ZRH4_9DIPT